MENGWLHTGDIGVIEKEGFLKITDRKKDIIITASGKNVAPQKIENLLKSNPHFLNVVVIGNRRPYLSALVVPNPAKVKQVAESLGLQASNYDTLIQNQHLYQYYMGEIERVAADLASFEQIKRIVLLENDFSMEKGELTATMKIRRRIVEEKYQKVIEQIYNKTEQG
jgi:long-chain acyl-CoA synthetase